MDRYRLRADPECRCSGARVGLVQSNFYGDRNQAVAVGLDRVQARLREKTEIREKQK